MWYMCNESLMHRLFWTALSANKRRNRDRENSKVLPLLSLNWFRQSRLFSWQTLNVRFSFLEPSLDELERTLRQLLFHNVE